MKHVLTLLGCLAVAVFIVVGIPVLTRSSTGGYFSVQSQETSLVEQNIATVSKDSHTVYRLYNAGQFVGVISDSKKLNAFLDEIYTERYEEDYPNSKCNLGTDLYLVEEESYFYYDNADDVIFQYLEDNNLFTLKCTGVEFSDDNGIYAQIYCASEELFNEAMNQYLELFIDASELAALNNGESTPALTTYGSRSTGVSIAQDITMHETYVPAEQIKTTMESILDYLEYGDDTEKEYYTVQAYDTVAGVGSKNYGLSATQVMNINRDQISSTSQVLSEGMELCVTYFNSPIDVVVTKESMKKETIYAETVYQNDDTIREGVTEKIQDGIDGSRNALYTERWINGVLVSGTLTSSVDTLQPVNEIIAIGTMEIPGVGTGTFRWPVDNAVITCKWGCYYGHRAIDVQNSYDHYGNVYAADRGVIEENSYNGINGNYVIINHNNGYETYYGHMLYPSPLEVGTVVDKGDVIGTIGQTGAATGPHVHFFIMLNGERQNPCNGFLDCG